jgi:predicted ArsR family transcriptional regulator
MEPVRDLDQRISAIAALDQPLRRQLHELLADRDDWTTRDAAAEALGVSRSVAAFHLDKLADAGVLEIAYQRTTGRTGPGAGRTSKLYRLVADELEASVPERHYDLAGALLAAAVAESTTSAAPVDQCLREVASSAGRTIGADALSAAAFEAGPDGRAPALVEVLRRNGYEPEPRDDEIALFNCPFHRLAEQHRALVCGMNLDLLTGVVEGIDATPEFKARLAPEPGYCCVRLTVRSAPPEHPHD